MSRRNVGGVPKPSLGVPKPSLGVPKPSLGVPKRAGLSEREDAGRGGVNILIEMYRIRYNTYIWKSPY